MEILLTGLPTLLSLARTGALTRTASELGVPRSTVSRRLARLEQHLGVALAERNTRSFKLTPEGQQLADEAGSFLARLKTAAERVQAEGREVRGHLRLGSPPGLGGAFVGAFLARFKREYPRVAVELLVTERRPHLIDEEFDVLLATELTPGLPWTRRTLGRSWVMAVASPSYLRDAAPLEKADDLENHVVLSTEGGREAMVTWPRLTGSSVLVQPGFVTNDLPTLRVTALEGLGIALLPAHLVFDDLLAGTLVQVLPAQIGAPLDIFALHAPERRKSPVVKAFFASLTSYVSELTQAMPTPERRGAR